MNEPIAVRLVNGALKPASSAPVAGAGAWLTFEGVVRPLENDRPLAAIVYEAYSPMTERELRRLAEQTLAGHALLAVWVEHSVGRVAVGETSFRLSVGAAHRTEAIVATDAFIAAMKRDVPLWKTPEYA